MNDQMQFDVVVYDGCSVVQRFEGFTTPEAAEVCVSSIAGRIGESCRVTIEVRSQ